MNDKTRITAERRGFSLLEMAVVITIIGIVAYGLISVTTAQTESNRIAETRQRLERVEQAMMVYFKTNGYLPCPAWQSAVETSNLATYRELTTTVANVYPYQGSQTSLNRPKHLGYNDNVATSQTTCNHTAIANSRDTYRDNGNVNLPQIYVGIVPARNLGLTDDYAFDAWGNRLTYVVTRYCVAPLNWQQKGGTYFNRYKCSANGATTGTASSPNQTNGGVININTAPSQTLTNGAVYVLISHGKNGIGAFNRNATKILGSAGEAERYNGNLNSSGADLGIYAVNNTYFDMPINDGTSGNYFDDIVRWKTPMQIYYDANK